MDYLLFTHDADYARAAATAGMAAIIVDWEWRGKPGRQAGHDTEINRGGVDDLIAIRAAVDCGVICRVNNHPACLHEDVSLAVQHGADEILLPMFRRIEEVEALLDVLDGRARLGVLVETVDAMQLGRDLEHLPISRVYVGLHDYRIDTGNHDLFLPLVDGTLDRFRETYRGAFGFAGITRPDGGQPIPQTLLLAAMLRLDCSFGVARRGFRASVPAQTMQQALSELDATIDSLGTRSPEEIAIDHEALRRLVEPCLGANPRSGGLPTACAS